MEFLICNARVSLLSYHGIEVVVKQGKSDRIER